MECSWQCEMSNENHISIHRDMFGMFSVHLSRAQNLNENTVVSEKGDYFSFENLLMDTLKTKAIKYRKLSLNLMHIPHIVRSRL